MGKNGAQRVENHMKTFFEVIPKQKVLVSGWEEIFAQGFARNVLGKFGQIRAKNFRTPKNLPAPTPRLSQVCTAPILSKSEKILMSLNRKANVTLPTGNHSTLPKYAKERVIARKSQKHLWVRCLRAVVFSLSSTRILIS